MDLNLRIHSAFKENDFEQLRDLLGHSCEFPNCHLEEFGHLLEYAIYHSSLSFINEMLDAGAEPNYEDHAGFPSIIAALSSERDDRKDIIDLLLKYGGDINQRGINDWTPLHWAAANNDVKLIEYLLGKGADPTLRTDIDDKATPLEEAEILGCESSVKILKRLKGNK